MITEITELMGLEIYTDKGYLLGTIDDVMLDVDDQTIYGLYIEKTNPLLVEDGVSVSVPYRWVRSVGDIIILKKFPGFISVSNSNI
jgi:sporulation protein YlmC with PRC-barrel domain